MLSEQQRIEQNIAKHPFVIYLDECAAGVLSGDLFIGAVVMSPAALQQIPTVNDSKKLTEKKRAALFEPIIQKALDYEIVRISAQEVDRLNIFQARMAGFSKAIDILSHRTGATYAIIDGNKVPQTTCITTDCLVKADALLPGVSCASILAKHSHTQYIQTLCTDPLYQKYGFANHKGYGTAEHLEALKKYGPIVGFHRQSYQPVKDALALHSCAPAS